MPPPPEFLILASDSSLTISGKAADVKVVDGRINLLSNQLEGLKTIKTTDDGWVCLTLECGIKICYFKGCYDQTEITLSEDSFQYGDFLKLLSTNFSFYPCVLTQ